MACCDNTQLCVSVVRLSKGAWRFPNIWKQGKNYRIKRFIRSYIFNSQHPIKAKHILDYLNGIQLKAEQLEREMKIKKEIECRLEIEDIRKKYTDKIRREKEEEIRLSREKFLDFISTQQEALHNVKRVSTNDLSQRDYAVQPPPAKKHKLNTISSFVCLQRELDKKLIQEQSKPMIIPEVHPSYELLAPVTMENYNDWTADAKFYEENKSLDKLPSQLEQLKLNAREFVSTKIAPPPITIPEKDKFQGVAAKMRNFMGDLDGSSVNLVINSVSQSFPESKNRYNNHDVIYPTPVQINFNSANRKIISPQLEFYASDSDSEEPNQTYTTYLASDSEDSQLYHDSDSDIEDDALSDTEISADLVQPSDLPAHYVPTYLSVQTLDSESYSDLVEEEDFNLPANLY